MNLKKNLEGTGNCKTKQFNIIKGKIIEINKALNVEGEKLL